MARVYWVRSLVPMAKKSASAARASAASAAPGISIMIPSGGPGSASLTPRRFSWAVRRAIMRRTLRISSSVQTIGNRMRTGPTMLARRIAESWVSSSLRRLKEKRMARKPNAGIRPGLHAEGVAELVGADVEGADGHRPAVHAPDDAERAP